MDNATGLPLVADITAVLNLTTGLKVCITQPTPPSKKIVGRIVSFVGNAPTARRQRIIRRKVSWIKVGQRERVFQMILPIIFERRNDGLGVPREASFRLCFRHEYVATHQQETARQNNYTLCRLIGFTF